LERARLTDAFLRKKRPKRAIKKPAQNWGWGFAKTTFLKGSQSKIEI